MKINQQRSGHEVVRMHAGLREQRNSRFRRKADIRVMRDVRKVP
jgi:hypothetical protein